MTHIDIKLNPSQETIPVNHVDHIEIKQTADFADAELQHGVNNDVVRSIISAPSIRDKEENRAAGTEPYVKEQDQVVRHNATAEETAVGGLRGWFHSKLQMKRDGMVRTDDFVPVRNSRDHSGYLAGYLMTPKLESPKSVPVKGMLRLVNDRANVEKNTRPRHY